MCQNILHTGKKTYQDSWYITIGFVRRSTLQDFSVFSFRVLYSRILLSQFPFSVFCNWRLCRSLHRWTEAVVLGVGVGEQSLSALKKKNIIITFRLEFPEKKSSLSHVL